MYLSADIYIALRFHCKSTPFPLVSKKYISQHLRERVHTKNEQSALYVRAGKPSHTMRD
jgi:hypothetical protein